MRLMRRREYDQDEIEHLHWEEVKDLVVECSALEVGRDSSADKELVDNLHVKESEDLYVCMSCVYMYSFIYVCFLVFVYVRIQTFYLDLELIIY